MLKINVAKSQNENIATYTFPEESHAKKKKNKNLKELTQSSRYGAGLSSLAVSAQ